jgi:hypothetical protein
VRTTRRVAAAFAGAAIGVAAARHADDRWTAVAVALVFGSTWLMLWPGRASRLTVRRGPSVGAVRIALPRTLRLRAVGAAACWSVAAVVLGGTGVLPLALAVIIGAAATSVTACWLVGALLVPQCVVLTSTSLFLPGTLRLVAVQWNDVEHVAPWRLLATPMIGIQTMTAAPRVHRRLSGYDWAIPAPMLSAAPGGLERVLHRFATDPLARVELDDDDAADKVAAMLHESVRS